MFCSFLSDSMIREKCNYLCVEICDESMNTGKSRQLGKHGFIAQPYQNDGT